MDLGDQLRQQIEDTINRSGLGGFLEHKEVQDAAVVTPSYVQLWIEVWIKDVAEQTRHLAYLKIEERTSRNNLREREAYWYGLIDKRTPGVDYYEGWHFHDEPTGSPPPVAHHQVEQNGQTVSWEPTALVTLSEAIGRLLRVYWGRSKA